MMRKWKVLLNKYKCLSKEKRAALWFAACNVINKGVSVILVPLYTRMLSTTEYGIYTVVQSWLNIFIIIATLEIADGHYKVGLVKYEKDSDGYTTSVLGLSNITTLVFGALYFIAEPIVSRNIGIPLSIMTCLVIYLLVHPAWEFWCAQQRFVYRYKGILAATVAIAVATPALGIVGVYVLNLGDRAAIFSKLLPVGGVAAVAYCSILLKNHQLLNTKYWKEAFLFSISLLPYLLSIILLSQADRIMIERLIGPSEAAIYSVAYAAAMLLLLINNAVSDAFIPWLYRKLKDKQYDEIEPATNKLLLLVAGINCLFNIVAPEAMKLFAPPEYHQAIWIIPPIASSVFFMFLFQRYINVEVYYGATKTVSGTSVLVALLNIILNYFCIRKWGYFAAAYTTLICYMLFSTVHFFNIRKVCREKCEGHQIFSAGTALVVGIVFMFLIFLIMLLYEHIILRYLLAGALMLLFAVKRNDIFQLVFEKDR